MNELEEMCRAHFNEPAIFGFEIARVIGYGEDEDDCYIIAAHPNGAKRPEMWHTCVGGYVFLDRLSGQGHVRSGTGEDWDDLYLLDNFLALNGAPKATEFKVVYEEPARALSSGQVIQRRA